MKKVFEKKSGSYPELPDLKRESFYSKVIVALNSSPCSFALTCRVFG